MLHGKLSSVVERPHIMLTITGVVLISISTTPAFASTEYYLTDGSNKAVQHLLDMERSHRRDFPNDEIIIHLPKQLSLTQPLALGPADSGTAQSPLIITGTDGNDAYLSGGIVIPTQLVQPNDPQYSNFMKGVRGVIRVAQLTGVNYRGGAGFSWPNVFSHNARLRPSKWPADGFFPLTSSSIGAAGTAIVLDGQEVNNVRNETNYRVEGYLGRDWFFESLSAKTGNGEIDLKDKPVYPLKAPGRFYVSNLASNLIGVDTFFLDQKSNLIYVILPPGETDIQVAVTPTLIQLSNVNNVIFRDVAFSTASDTAVKVDHGQNIRFESCYIGHTGTAGIVITDGTRDALSRCVITDTGGMGALIDGGRRDSLRGGDNGIFDSYISLFGQVARSYKPGIGVSGVGNHVVGNEISYGPHAAIMFSGNDHEISGNVIHDVVLEAGDAGAIYAGRDWTMRGNSISQNFLYSIRSSVTNGTAQGIYLDDEFSGTSIVENIFSNVDLPILIGGGRDNVVQLNLFLLGAKRADVVVDQRGLTWQKSNDIHNQLVQSAEKALSLGSLYTGRYKGISTVLTDRPGAPVGNEIVQNFYTNGSLISFDVPWTSQYVSVANNVGLLQDSDGGSYKALMEMQITDPVIAGVRQAITKTKLNAYAVSVKWGARSSRQTEDAF